MDEPEIKPGGRWQFRIIDLLMLMLLVSCGIAPFVSVSFWWFLPVAIIADVILFCFIAGAYDVEE